MLFGESRQSGRAAPDRQKVQAKSPNGLGISVALNRQFLARRGGMGDIGTNRIRRAHDPVLGHLNCFVLDTTLYSSPYPMTRAKNRVTGSSNRAYRKSPACNTSPSHAPPTSLIPHMTRVSESPYRGDQFKLLQEHSIVRSIVS